jgi:hypothetical protein
MNHYKRILKKQGGLSLSNKIIRAANPLGATLSDHTETQYTSKKTLLVT